MWAKTRSRNGKIALFIIGYLLFVMVAVLVALGGVGAGIAAIRTGRAERIAQVVLSGLFINAVMATILLGFGMSAVFSEAELLRYPLHERERFVARHFLGIADPFWILVLLVELGLVFGMYVLGACSLGYGTGAALLLFVCGYLFARAIGAWIDGLMATRSGSGVVLLLIFSISILPRIMLAALQKNPAARKQVLDALRFTPPFGAAAAMTHTGGTAFAGLGLIVLWSIGLALFLVWLERRPATAPRQQAIRGVVAGKADFFDRLGRLFPPDIAPLVSHWLHFFVRNKRFRMLYLFSFPLAAFLTWNLGQLPKGHGDLFVAALGTLPMVTFIGTSRIAVNLYGYMGDAFRRYFLFPTDPAASLRAGSYASVLLGGFALLPGAIVWAIFAPSPLDFGVIVMPVINGLTVLFLFNSAGLWTTLFGPRRGKYDRSLGNDMSLLGNIVVIGSALTCLLTPQILRRVAPDLVSRDNWWMLLPAAFAIMVYVASLRAAGALFTGRRERLLAVVEGKA
ncbi:MAG TPA: hypothetical protein VK789_20680 [Bryobacteraceae bacterium]|nr:hypothetical protein [Bryobacteraceae bacterium]